MVSSNHCDGPWYLTLNAILENMIAREGGTLWNTSIRTCNMIEVLEFSIYSKRLCETERCSSRSTAGFVDLRNAELEFLGFSSLVLDCLT